MSYSFKRLGRPERTNDNWTWGITCKHRTDPDRRLFMFELDGEHMDYLPFVTNVLADIFEMVLIHCTGRGTHLFALPPTDKESWKIAHKILEDVNPSCPMTTLRITPNKWEGEELVWYHGYVYFRDEKRVSELNKKILEEFFKMLQEHFVAVQYPLPPRDDS